MFQDKYVFAQLVSFLNRSKFNRLVSKYKGDKYVKHFSCWNQLLVLMFGQLSNRESLRSLIVALDAHYSKCYHLGMGKNISRSSLARANQDRDYHIFEEYAYYLVNQAREKKAVNIFNLDGNVYAFDSTTIDLCLSVFWWAKFRKNKGGIKIHTLYDVETQIPTFFHITEASMHDSKAMKEIPYEPGSYYIFDRAYNNFKMLYKIHQIGAYFVVRAKRNLQYRSIKWKRRLPKKVLSDQTIELTGFYPKRYYPGSLRLVRYWDEKQRREFIFLTNAIHISALQVDELYKNRWQVELFFKWLKQHLKIKKFWGTTENAVRIQIYAAICAYCLVAIVQHDMKQGRSTYEVLQILSISLTDKTNLRELFSKTKFQNDKERDSLNGPNLFNF
ncbi:IS4 family transposase [Flavobacteriaceae bacterium F89]|uniref:IS4 family transposase n=1 Tax=Cerina litoralis TaxID=2874477 RepID=A0AAE3JSI7_9FLAO|nr:IS4 family transposase [Cerina litoralis]MCG2462553.1 IS4 family transposase [Cerina litoralis]